MSRAAVSREISGQELFMRSLNEYNLLTTEEEIQIGQAIQIGRDAWQLATAESRSMTTNETEQFYEGLAAGEKLFHANLLLIPFATRGYRLRSSDAEGPDIIQAGAIGLHTAVEKFDWRKGFKFSTFATGLIKRSAQRHLHNHGRLIRAPVHVNMAFTALAKYETFCDSDEEIIEHSGWSHEQIQEIRRSKGLGKVQSLDTPLLGDWRIAHTLYDVLPDEAADEVEAVTDSSQTLGRALAVARSLLTQSDYAIYIASVEYKAGLRDTSPAEESSKTKEELRGIRLQVGAAVKHPSSNIIAHEQDGLEWQNDSECSGVPVEIFFPKRGESVQMAAEFCGACVVRDQCLEYALQIGAKHGIWGGTSERQRRQLRQDPELKVVA